MATWAETVLCTMNDLPKISEFLTQEQNSSDAQTAIEECIAKAKNEIRRELQLTFKNKYPETVANFKNLLISNRFNGRTVNDITEVRNSGYLNLDLAYFDVPEETGWINNPYAFFNYGAPTSNTFSSVAVNGSWLLDTMNNRIYIYRMVDDVNTWVRFSAKDMVDYILNPEELFSAAVYCSVYYLFEYRAQNDSSNSTMNLEYYNAQKIINWEDYKEELKKAMGLLDVDLSGDLDIDDFEQGALEEHFGFVA